MLTFSEQEQTFLKVILGSFTYGDVSQKNADKWSKLKEKIVFVDVIVV